MASHGNGADLPKYGDSEGERKAAVSFGFAKTVSKFKPNNDAAIPNDETDYLTGVDGKELLSTKPVNKPKELIIPLIHKNRWCDRVDKETREDKHLSKPQQVPHEDGSVESQAVRELIEDSQRQQEKWQNGEKTDLNLSIPLLMQNQVPEGFEDGDKVKVDLRPESSTNADYDSVPVEAYGLAMLKGMGWNQEEGIGRTFKQNVKPIEHQLRPKGLGLGADRSAIKDLEPKARRRVPKPGDELGKDDDLVLGPGGCVLVESGAHRELYGKIEGIDADNARVVVKLAIGGKTVTISQYGIKLVDQKEYERNSKDISRLSKAHKEKEKVKEREKEKESSRKADEKKNKSAEGSKHKSSERDRDRSRDERKRKHRDSSPDRAKPAVKEPRKLPAVPCWLQRDLKVRFIDKAFKGGRFYNSKMRVEDVVTPTTCICRTEEGKLLDDVKQTMLETIVPKLDSEAIMVVLGKHRGQVGRILQRDRERGTALVQLERYEEEVFNLDYDTICHYLGAVDH